MSKLHLFNFEVILREHVFEFMRYYIDLPGKNYIKTYHADPMHALLEWYQTEIVPSCPEIVVTGNDEYEVHNGVYRFPATLYVHYPHIMIPIGDVVVKEDLKYKGRG